MNYYCKRCGYSVSRKDDLRKHLSRKKPCRVKYLDLPTETLIHELKGKYSDLAQNSSKIAHEQLKILKKNEPSNIYKSVNPLECIYCNKIYSKTSNLKRHLEKCKEKDKKAKIKQDENNFKDEEIALMKEIIANEKEEKDLLKKQIELLMTKIGNIENNNYNTTNNTTNNNTNNTVNIQINGWGEEDRSHLTDKFLRFCYDRPFTSIQRVIEAVFFNPNCPKNWNIMIKDDKSSKALIYDSEKDAWLKKESNGVVDDLMYTGYSILDENFDKQRDANKLTDRLIEKFTNFQDFYTKGDKDFEKRLATEIKELLINYKAYHIIKT